MVNSVRKRMGLVFLAFAALVIVSVAASYWIIETQAQDALIINLAGRQRMLIQQMTKDALQIEKGQGDLSLYRRDLAEAAQTFEQTLQAFVNGGPAPYLPTQPATIPATTNPAIVNTLYQLAQNWASFQKNLEIIGAARPDSPQFAAASRAIEQAAPNLVQQADVAVRLFENESAQKVTQLRQIQLLFLASALILLAAGVWLTQRSVIEPLRELGQAASRIGLGDLDTAVTATGPEEIARLSKNFDWMRARLKTAQEELESQVRQRTRELANAFEFSQEIVTELELERLLASVTSRARDLLDAQAASICLLTPQGTDLVLKASSGVSAARAGIIQSAHRQPIAARVVGQGQTVVTETACANCQFLRAHGPGQCVATPLRIGEHTLGALCVVRTESQQFDPAETRALSLLANSAATAITNANLVEAEQAQARETASLAERDRLAAELHDNLAQTLGFLNLKVDRLSEMVSTCQAADAQAELGLMKSAIGTAYGQVRAALVGLREPPAAAEGELAEKLAASVNDLRQSSGIDARLQIIDPAALALSGVAQKQALHIVKESLNNVRRHAGARRVWVNIDRINGDARLVVRDDGHGFDPAQLSGGSHYGLTIMRARAERVGGSLEVDSAPGGGTKIIARLPLESRSQESGIRN